ncbi:phosphotransferase enzyme family protein [Bacteroidota bacterium]
MKPPLEIVNKFAVDVIPAAVSPIGSGHINDSYLIRTSPDESPDYVLQRINHAIFKDISGLMNNIEVVTGHLRKKLKETSCNDRNIKVLEVIPTLEGDSFYRDGEGNYWRLYHHIFGSRSYDRIENPELAYEGGRAFGEFQALTSEIDPGTLAITIPRFHDITWRIEQFEEVLANDPAGRKSETTDEIRFVQERMEEMHTIHRLINSGQLTVRVTHNDTKFNNILFNSKGEAICIVDLDTLMPGTLLYDFGDAIRTGANSGNEDEADLKKVGIDMALFEAYTKGFLDAAGAMLTPVEQQHLVFSARFMTFIIGLRFFTDHLNGDTYYKIHHPGHNLQRARAQFKLLESMEREAERMREVVEGLVR